MWIKTRLGPKQFFQRAPSGGPAQIGMATMGRGGSGRRPLLPSEPSIPAKNPLLRTYADLDAYERPERSQSLIGARCWECGLGTYAWRTHGIQGEHEGLAICSAGCGSKVCEQQPHSALLAAYWGVESIRPGGALVR